MKRLSISQAWTETTARLNRDGKLYFTVGLALFTLPTVLTGLVNGQSSPANAGAASSIVLLVTVVAMLIGQIAIGRLAVSGQSSVGEALRHGAARSWVLVAGLFIAVVPLAILYLPIVQAMRGYQPGTAPTPAMATAAFGLLVWLALVVWLASRLMLMSAIVANEPTGPIVALRRCFTLSRGHVLKLLGLLILFLLGASIVSFALSRAVGSVVLLLLGPPDPLTVSALILGLVDGLLQAAISVVFSVLLARIYAQLAALDAGTISVPSSGT